MRHPSVVYYTKRPKFSHQVVRPGLRDVVRSEDLGRHLAQLTRLERDRLAVRSDLVRV